MNFEQRLRTRLLTVFLLIMICFTMTGCSIFDAIGNFFASLFGFLFVALGGVLCFWAAATIAPTILSGTRGTNSFTRFVRDANMNAKLGRKYLCLIVSIPLLAFGGMLLLGTLGALLCIIPIGIMAIIVVFMAKSNKSEQRKKDARVVTKTTAKVTAKVAEPVATAAAIAAAPVTGGGSLALAAGIKVAGAAITDVAESVDKNMTDVQVEGFEMQRTVKAIESIPMKGDPNLMLDKAAHLGIAVNGRSIEEVAQEVISLAPAATLRGLPEDMAPGDKAMAILSAFQQAQAQQPAALPNNARG